MVREDHERHVDEMRERREREDVKSINSMVETIATKVMEDTENFIFVTITPYCKEITKREISKKDLACALTQYFSKEPCEDAISRDAVLDTTICEGISCNECSFNEINGESGCLLHARISELPSVTPSRPTEHKPICDNCIYFADGKGSEKCDSCELTGTNKESSDADSN